MWPDLMGPGWELHFMATVGLLAGLIASLGLLASVASRREPESPDPFLELWHRYEVGDLTRQEFVRQKRALNHREVVRAAWARWARTPASETPKRSAAPPRGALVPDRTPTEL